MTHTFKITEAFFANVYEGHSFEGEKPGFSLAIRAEELPEHLTIYTRSPKRNEFLGFDIITIPAGRRSPRVGTYEGRNGASNMDTIFRFARNANIPLDRLLRSIPMELACEVVEFDVSQEGRKTLLFLRAIRVHYTELLRRYDELEAEFWA